MAVMTTQQIVVVRDWDAPSPDIAAAEAAAIEGSFEGDSRVYPVTEPQGFVNALMDIARVAVVPIYAKVIREDGSTQQEAISLSDLTEEQVADISGVEIHIMAT